MRRYDSHLDAAQKHVVPPLIGEPVLSQYRRDLAPVPNVVQENVRRDLVLARRDRARRHRLKRQNAIQLLLRRCRQKVH